MIAMYTEDQLLPISALQHLAFCPRQWALIHIEQLWAENYLTAEGRNLHEKTHTAEPENRPDIRIARGLRLHSFRLGLTGQSDVVEFHKSDSGFALKGVKGLWQPVPVEYKRGKAKKDNCDKVQLCAQALCLEEMLNVKIENGALYYGRPRRRQQVSLNDMLRKQTETLTGTLHKLYESKETPKAKYQKKCKSCSLFNVCMPKVTGINKNIEHYLSKAIEDQV